jgi:1-deoxy-D-xylulose-5-phosphate synthase
MLSRVPGMRVLAPSSAQELQQMMLDALALADDGPVAIRYPRGAARQVAEHDVGSGLSARRITAGDGSVCVLAIGKMVEAAGKAADRFAGRGTAVEVWDVRSCVPLDRDMIAAAGAHDLVVTVEDGVRDGGVGMTIADQVRAQAPGTRVVSLGLPSRFIPHGDAQRIIAQLGLDADGIERTIREHMA